MQSRLSADTVKGLYPPLFSEKGTKNKIEYQFT